MDPCLQFVKMAKKNLGFRKKNPWTAALFFIQAAECYLNADEKRKAFRYAYQAVNLLEKFWSHGKNDVVLSDLEKALGLAFRVAPKNKRGEIKKKAFKIYLYHANKLKSSGNLLGASEKYEAAVQYAPDGNKAEEALLKAIAVLEKLRERESVIKNRSLREKVESRLEHLRSLLPKREEEKATELAEKVAAKFSVHMELEVLEQQIQEAIKRISSKFPLRTSDVYVEKKGGDLIVSFRIPGLSAVVNTTCKKTLCIVDIYSPHLGFSLEAASCMRYFLDAEEALREPVSFSFRGYLDRKQLLVFIRKISRMAKARDDGKKVAHYLGILADFLSGQNKKLSSIAKKIGEVAKSLMEIYVVGSSLLNVDSQKVASLMEEVDNLLGGGKK